MEEQTIVIDKIRYVRIIEEICKTDEHEWMITYRVDGAADMEQFVLVGTTDEVIDFLWNECFSLEVSENGEEFSVVSGTTKKEDVIKCHNIECEDRYLEKTLADMGQPIFLQYSGLLQNTHGEYKFISVQATMKLDSHKRLNLSKLNLTR